MGHHQVCVLLGGVVLGSGREPLYLFEKCKKKRYLHRIFECTCRIIWGPGTVGSLGTYTAAQIEVRRRFPLP